MKKTFHIYFSFFMLGIPHFTWAGDSGPLCDTVKRSKNIVEIEVEIKDPSPSTYLQKNWAPENKHIIQTAETAKIIGVLKGDQNLVGKTLASILFSKQTQKQALKMADYIYPLSMRNHFVRDLWLAFYQAKKVRLLVSIPEPTLQGWFESNTCNVSICKDYEKHKKNILHCF